MTVLLADGYHCNLGGLLLRSLWLVMYLEAQNERFYSQKSIRFWVVSVTVSVPLKLLNVYNPSNAKNDKCAL